MPLSANPSWKNSVPFYRPAGKKAIFFRQQDYCWPAGSPCDTRSELKHSSMFVKRMYAFIKHSGLFIYNGDLILINEITWENAYKAIKITYNVTAERKVTFETF